MKRGMGWLKYYVAAGVVLGTVNSAWALGGPFDFSLAAGFLNNIFLWPLRLVGCG